MGSAENLFVFQSATKIFEFATRDYVLNMDTATTEATELSEEQTMSESGDVHIKEDGARSRFGPLTLED